MIVESKQNWLGMHLNWTKKKKKERRNWDDANIFELRGDDGGRDGVGCDGTVARGDKESVEVRGVGWGPSGSENGSGLDFPLLENGFSVCVFVPVRGVTAHRYSPLAAFVLQLLRQQQSSALNDDVLKRMMTRGFGQRPGWTGWPRLFFQFSKWVFLIFISCCTFALLIIVIMYESKKKKFNYLILSPWIPIAQNELFDQTEVRKYFFSV